MRNAVFLIALLIASRGLLADTIILTDGTRLEGDVKKTDKGWTIVTSDGQTVEVLAEKVKSIQLGEDATTGTPQRATADLKSLRRSVENLSDLNIIIDRLNRFIEQNKDTPAATEAQKDLLVWQDRFDRDLVKLGSKWVTRHERSEFANQALWMSDQARELIAQGRHRDGIALITQALEADLECAPALYLLGAVEYQNNHLPQARKCFEAVLAQRIDHASSLNNIAVILWRQNARIPALTYYDKAITAAPGNKLILDNVAVALAALSDDQRKHKTAHVLLGKFTEQDKRLQESMAAKGWYRWGTLWIDEEAKQKLRDQEKDFDDRVSAVLEPVEDDREQLRQLDERLTYVQARIHRIFMNTPVPFPGFIRMPFPPVYFELQKEEDRLLLERTGLATKVELADAEILRIKAQMPKPNFGGTQKVIGVEGTPAMGLNPGQLSAPQPTRSPSTAPAKDER
ncbi:MAG: tetratricopeptide repeat protein [Anaerolineae bacterium]|nr:tetratricopeptide repeat protein [Phycisphaerae bacterium]